MSEQISFESPFAAAFVTNEFADNPEPRCPCLLLLDVSGSMAGAPLAALNEGLVAFKQELAQDALALKRVEVGIVTFGPVKDELPFTAAAQFEPPTLLSQGATPMGEAIEHGIAMVHARKDMYRANGVSYYRPWIFLITDGTPTDDWQAAAAALREGEASKKFAFFAVGVQGANMDVLRQLSTREPLALTGLKFRELFSWLSTSMRSVSMSTMGAEVPLEAPKGWASV